jgi:hypothetical protein
VLVYRNIYYLSFICGVLLTGCSVGWWWHYHPVVYVFRGTVSNLRSYEVVKSPTLYMRIQPRDSAAGDPEQYSDVKIIAVQDHPFTKGQKLELDYFKAGEKTTQRLWLPFPGQANDDVQFRIDFVKGEHVITLDEQAAVSEGEWGTILPVFAQDAPSPYAGSPEAGRGSAKDKQSIPDQSSDTFEVLSSSKSPVGAKVSALQELASHGVVPWLWTGGQEPGLITILDLSRYADEEVSYYAQQYLILINVSSQVVKLLSDPETVELGRKVFRHLDASSAGIVINWMETINAREAESLRQLGTTLQLVGTPSASGDLYYVRAFWNPSNVPTVTCLTQVFNQELESNRSLADERAMMVGRRTRLVYWTTKDWAAHIAERITKCGGRATFVDPFETSRGR